MTKKKHFKGFKIEVHIVTVVTYLVCFHWTCLPVITSSVVFTVLIS